MQKTSTSLAVTYQVNVRDDFVNLSGTFTAVLDDVPDPMTVADWNALISELRGCVMEDKNTAHRLQKKHPNTPVHIHPILLVRLAN